MVVPVYIAELSPKRMRGRLVSFTALALSGGTLVRDSLIPRLTPVLVCLGKPGNEAR